MLFKRIITRDTCRKGFFSAALPGRLVEPGEAPENKHWRPFFLAHDEKDNEVAQIIGIFGDKEIDSNEIYYKQ
jgi:hypothetical protein